MKLASEADVRAACALNERLLQAKPWSPSRMSLREIHAEVERAADFPLEQAITLPAAAYTSPEYFDWECREVFGREWQCVAHVSQIPKPGDFLTVDLLGEPLLVVHGKDGEIRALSRVCPHRGMDIMPPGFGREGHAGQGPADPRDSEGCAGHTRLLLCPYHSWTFELDGSLKACPEMHRARGFHREEWALKTFRSEIWQGFIFVNLDGRAAMTPAQALAEVEDYIGQWTKHDLVPVVRREWDCPFNWKVLVENFMESYHHVGAHSNTLQLLMPARDTWTEQERAHFIRCHLPFREKVREKIRRAQREGRQFDAFPPIPGLDQRSRFEWGLVLGFPNFMLATAPDSLIWYRQLPLGPERHILTTTLLVPRAVAEHPDFPKWFPAGEQAAIAFHLEDMECCTAVQRGYSSTGYQVGRLSHLEMPIWLFQRYLAARARGTWPTKDRAAAPGQQ